MAYFYIESTGMLAKGRPGELTPKEILDAEKGWIKDEWSIVSDYLAGFDSSEEPGSPYRYGNGAIMRQIEKIDAKRAKEIMSDYKFVIGDRPEKWNP